MSAAVIPAGAWSVDAARSTVEWSVKHLGVSTVHGSVGGFDGRMGDGSASGTVRAASVRSDDPKRDAYVRSPEFLDADEFPELTFSVNTQAADDGRLTGELTIRDTTLPLSLDVKRPTPADGELHLQLSGTVRRRAYGLRFPQAFGAADRSVTDEVEIALDLVFVPAD